MRHFHRARAHAAEIHDVVQLGAGMLACIALLVFMLVSGREPDDPVMRLLADFGAAMTQSELALPDPAGDVGTAPAYLASSTAP